MQTTFSLLKKRKFLPLFVTQLLGAFNDNLFKNAMVLFVVYGILDGEESETFFSAIATAVFIIPFVLLSALAGQLADTRDKAKIIRIIKFCEILIMIVGGAGLILAANNYSVHGTAIPLMMIALAAMGVHSTFFGPIKYAILPQHLADDEVLGGTGLVEAGTYIAILAGTILAGLISAQTAAYAVVITALIGYVSGRQVPPAPAEIDEFKIDWNLFRSSYQLVRGTMHIRRLFLAILSISFFWTIGAVLFIQFPPLVKNVLTADKAVASLFLAVFSIGIAIGSVAINRLLKGQVSARYAPVCVLVMAAFVVMFHVVCRNWVGATDGRYISLLELVEHPGAPLLLGSLLGIAVSGGMFVVPLYAFLTTTVAKSETARTVAANNIVNCAAMVVGSLLALGVSKMGMPVVDQLLMSAGMCLFSAWLGYQLHRACDEAQST
jgi:Major Facilitator Superfamily